MQRNHNRLVVLVLLGFAALLSTTTAWACSECDGIKECVDSDDVQLCDLLDNSCLNYGSCGTGSGGADGGLMHLGLGYFYGVQQPNTPDVRDIDVSEWLDLDAEEMGKRLSHALGIRVALRNYEFVVSELSTDFEQNPAKVLEHTGLDMRWRSNGSSLWTRVTMFDPNSPYVLTTHQAEAPEDGDILVLPDVHIGARVEVKSPGSGGVLLLPLRFDTQTIFLVMKEKLIDREDWQPVQTRFLQDVRKSVKLRGPSFRFTDAPKYSVIGHRGVVGDAALPAVAIRD